MSNYARSQIEAILRRHSIGAFNGSQTACSCDRTWRSNAEHRTHVTDALLAALNEDQP